MLPRSAASALAALAPATRVRVAGRVIALAESSFTLQDDTGCVKVSFDRPQPLGAIVQVHGVWHEGVIDDSVVVVESRGSDKFTRADSDFTFLSGKRLTNLRARAQLLRATRAFFDAE